MSNEKGYMPVGGVVLCVLSFLGLFTYHSLDRARVYNQAVKHMETNYCIEKEDFILKDSEEVASLGYKRWIVCTDDQELVLDCPNVGNCIEIKGGIE